MLTCEGCYYLDNPPEPYEVSCREGGKWKCSLRCALYTDIPEKVLVGVLNDIQHYQERG